MFNKERLKKLRSKESGFIQADIAEKLNIKRETYTRYENGTIVPPSDMVGLLSDIFKVSTDWLLNKTDDPTPANKKNTASPEKLKLLDGIGYAYFGRDGKELDDDDVDDILKVVEMTRKAREKRNKENG